MSTEPMIRELFRGLESTLHERLALIEQILRAVEKPKVPLYDNEFVKRIERLEQQQQQQQQPPHSLDVSYFNHRINSLELQLSDALDEIETLKKRPFSMIPQAVEVIEPEEVVGEIIEEEHEVVEEEEAAEEELELEEFEYKGVTYYKDQKDNIYGTDGDGELLSEPIGFWNGKKIVAPKQ